MTLKEGVKLHGMQPQTLFAILVADEIWKAQGVELVVTSVSDGVHKRASKHYTGCAADLRSHVLPDPKAAAYDLKMNLGRDFDVIYEGAGMPNAHIHVEWDPKDAPPEIV